MTSTLPIKQSPTRPPDAAPNRPKRVAPRIAPLCAALAGLVSLLVLIGWLEAYFRLWAFPSSWHLMAQSTAFSFLVFSVSLWLLQMPGRTTKHILPARFFSGIGIVIAAIVLIRFLLVLSDPALHLLDITATINEHDHMSPNSAINMILLGAALLLIDVRWANERRPSQLLAIIVILDGLLAVVGQLYGITSFYGFSRTIVIAIPTALLLILLSLGVLFARPERSFMAIVLGDNAAGRNARRLMPIVIGTPIALGVLTVWGARLHNMAAPLLIYVFVVVIMGTLASLLWDNILDLHAEIKRSASFERRIAEIERERIENALRTSEARMEFIVDEAGIGTWHWNMKTDEFACSDTAKRLLGLPSGCIPTAALLLGRVHPQERSAVQKAVRAAFASGTIYDLEHRVILPDGAIHWVAAKGRAFNDENGKPIRCEGILYGIDDRKMAEQTLRESARRQQKLLHDVLETVTEGRLRLCETAAQLPNPLSKQYGTIAITETEGLYALRERIKEVATEIRFPDERWHDLMTAASEAGMNCVVHGGGRGAAKISADSGAAIQVHIQDFGGGIQMEDLPKAALIRGWSTTTSLGYGLKMMLQTVDRVWLFTSPTGTTVVLEQDRAPLLPNWML